MEVTMQGFYVNLPNTEVTFFKEFIRKMGWSISNYPIQEQVVQNENTSDIPTDIMNLLGIASSISEKDVKNDDKLSYLLRK